MEKINIAENKYYTISVDTAKNRAYLKIIGFWKNTEVVPSYLSDWQKALTYLKPGMTLLTDASEMLTHPQEVRKLHEQAQALVLKHNLTKVAEVVVNDISEMQLDSVAKTTKFPKKNFTDKEAAEMWLDEPV
jgi:hypothetical protein